MPAETCTLSFETAEELNIFRAALREALKTNIEYLDTIDAGIKYKSAAFKPNRVLVRNDDSPLRVAVNNDAGPLIVDAPHNLPVYITNSGCPW
ncbi:hypothetical protein [Prosthecobacter sp.]|uniref:hypothetical protein n=1 Tax=Prosthecobacter sp. TaxID=1965333 RepID=UPI002AB889F3|nr:hypothetical protein [Prosthecobacter sp.]MDZ4403501.1 hypothetical protein [Prosthecobacter sp.]